jgi:hypothetical protein
MNNPSPYRRRRHYPGCRWRTGPHVLLLVVDAQPPPESCSVWLVIAPAVARRRRRVALRPFQIERPHHRRLRLHFLRLLLLVPLHQWCVQMTPPRSMWLSPLNQRTCYARAGRAPHCHHCPGHSRHCSRWMRDPDPWQCCHSLHCRHLHPDVVHVHVHLRSGRNPP